MNALREALLALPCAKRERATDVREVTNTTLPPPVLALRNPSGYRIAVAWRENGEIRVWRHPTARYDEKGRAT